jgi:hypothetical protein
LPETVIILAGKLFTSFRAWIFRKALDTINDPETIFFRDLFQFLNC